MDEVPLDYLQWALDNMDKLRPDTKAAIRASVARRQAGKPAPTPGRAAAVAAAASKAAETPTKNEDGDVEVGLPCPACGEILRLTLSSVPF